MNQLKKGKLEKSLKDLFNNILYSKKTRFNVKQVLFKFM